MKIHFRLFSIFLVIILLFSFLSVNSFAAGDENLISPDMSNWQFQDVYGEWKTPAVTYSNSNNSNTISFGTESVSQGDIFAVYDLTSQRLKSGDSYHFSLTIDSSTLDFLWKNNFTNFFNDNGIIVGFATIDNTGFIEFKENCVIDISTDNFNSFLVSDSLLTVDYDFVCPSYVGTPCFCIMVYRNVVRTHFNLLYNFSNLSLIHNTSPEYDGILGWLQELWGSITGGFDRIQTKIGEVITNISGELQAVTEGITTKLGEVITNLSGELQSVREGITTKLGEVITNLSSSLTSLGDRIQIKLGEVISGLTAELRLLGQNIINYLLYFDDEVPENPFKGVDSPLDNVQGFFDDLVDYLSSIGDDIETVIDSITGPVTLLDHFTKRFEWLFGIVVFTLMLIVVSRFIGL